MEPCRDPTARNPCIEDAVIRLLIGTRLVSFFGVLIALVLLILFGERVQYEQSLQSFFAEDDPVVIDYSRASKLFGNDNLVFVAYDDPELLTPEGMDRVAELAAAIGPDRIGPVVSVQSLDAMPLFWRIDDELVRIESLPGFLRTGAKALLTTAAAKLDPTAVDSLTVGGAIRLASPEDRAGLIEKITTHPLLEGTVVDATGTSTAIVVRLAGMGEQEPRDTLAALRLAADTFAAAAWPGTAGPGRAAGACWPTVSRRSRPTAVGSPWSG